MIAILIVCYSISYFCLKVLCFILESKRKRKRSSIPSDANSSEHCSSFSIFVLIRLLFFKTIDNVKRRPKHAIEIPRTHIEYDSLEKYGYNFKSKDIFGKKFSYVINLKYRIHNRSIQKTKVLTVFYVKNTLDIRNMCHNLRTRDRSLKLV